MIRCFAIAFAVTVGCSDAPTAPTPVIAPAPPPARTDPYDDNLWRELVFDGYESPAGASSATSMVLTRPVTPAWEMAVQVVDHPALTDSRYRSMGAVLRHMVLDVSGYAWPGPYRVVSIPRPQIGALTVAFTDSLTGGRCGQATIGAWPARILLRADHECIRPGSFEELIAHEFGHVLGFRHVSDWNLLMFPGGARRSTYRMTGAELWHAQLAYEVGRGQRYCGGWPVDAC